MVILETLQDIFKNKAFQIPDYQRGYAWETEQIQDLLNDIEDLERLGPDKKHYTGTLVLHKGQHEPANVLGQKINILDIVDGQQRLTTLIILLNCIVKELKQLAELDIPDAKETSNNLQKEYIGDERLQKLSLNSSINRFFIDHIICDQPNPDPELPAHRNLLNAKEEFRKYLNSRKSKIQDNQQWFDHLLYLVGLITSQLGFVYYEVENEADVGIMFEVMNARGKQLTQLEKVKNYLMYIGGKVSDDERALRTLTREINDTWHQVLQAMVDAGTDADEDQFLRYHWAIYPGAEWYQENRPDRTFDIHKAVKKTLNLRNGKSSIEIFNGVENYLESLRNSVRAYRDLLNPQNTHAFQFAPTHYDELLEKTLNLRRIGRSATVMPLLMAAYQQFGNRPDELCEILRLAEVFVFRLIVLEKYANTGLSWAYRIAAQVMNNTCSSNDCINELKEMIQYYCTDKQLNTVISDRDRDFYDWDGIKYFLYEYERYLAKQPLSIDWNQFYARKKTSTIEHILPKGDNTLAVPYWSQRFNYDQFLANRNRLGNLCLTDWNSHYQNKGFDDKKGIPNASPNEKVYRNSPWAMERDLIKCFA
ncbi:hypothetical protein SPSYN_01109 [Sporotomaculum syntrophicum]|uniref:DUF262 domain-containing protein n=1 Tax=Sporotomaculum syntrophicum TaxID=182264 RepID=A0A9D3AYP1_9FIRM|nr:DUF262 domain-containing protein [Sporotomaculum syntrophicum]KAF1084973.1 hypothetical protein SPSYN_01109 [Sporotomaculum syntrophicum]